MATSNAGIIPVYYRIEGYLTPSTISHDHDTTIDGTYINTHKYELFYNSNGSTVVNKFKSSGGGLNHEQNYPGITLSFPDKFTSQFQNSNIEFDNLIKSCSDQDQMFFGFDNVIYTDDYVGFSGNLYTFIPEFAYTGSNLSGIEIPLREYKKQCLVKVSCSITGDVMEYLVDPSTSAEYTLPNYGLITIGSLDFRYKLTDIDREAEESGIPTMIDITIDLLWF